MDIKSIKNPRVRAMAQLCAEVVPGFRLVLKEESSLMKFLSVFARVFNPAFMTEYATTIGKTIYIPKSFLEDEADGFMLTTVLAHELVHMDEELRTSAAYKLRYFFPQILALLALLSISAIWYPWCLLGLVFLLLLAPWPAPGRMEIELNGYTMSMAAVYWEYGAIPDETLEFYAVQFTGPLYYFMWPWKKDVLHRLKMRAQLIRTDEILRDPLYFKVRKLLKATY